MSRHPKKHGGYCAYKIAEYNSKRNLRPKQKICAFSGLRIQWENIGVHMSKKERYILRSVYGSKY
jgi:hypothetical protein